MKRFFCSILLLILLFIFFPVVTYAAEEIPLDKYDGLACDNNGTKVYIYGPRATNYGIFTLFYAKGSVLNQYDDLFLRVNSDGNCALKIWSSKLPKPEWKYQSETSYRTESFSLSLCFNKTFSGSSDFTYRIDYDTFDDDLYYYFFTAGLTGPPMVYATSVYTVPRAVPTPTPTPTPTPIPTPTPDVGDYPGKAIVDQFSIDQNGAVYPNQSFKVFPYSVEISDSVDPPDIDKGKAYVLHYKFSFPARFFYDGHSGSGYSYPTVMEDLAIEPYYVNTGNNSFSFGQSDVYIDNDQISCDYLNNLQSHTGSTGNKSYLSGKVGYALLNVPVVDTLSLYSYDLTVEWSAVLTKFDNDIVPPQANDLSCTVTVGSISYEDQFKHVSDQLDSDALSQIKDNTAAIKDEQKKQNEIDNQHYQEEQDKISEAEGSITEGAGQLTDTLSSWEIFTMPFQIVQDFAGAIASDGSTGLTFPSFTLMGQQLWPSYTFDLQVIAQKFPALYNALHLITGIMVVSWFIHYCWRKWHILMGDDMPEDT